MDMAKFVMYGVLILILMNLLLFFYLLLNKVKNNKVEENARQLVQFYKAIVFSYLKGNTKEIPKPKNAQEMSLLKEVILDAFDEYGLDHHEDLRTLSRQTGFLDEELKALKGSSDSRRAIAAYSLGVMGAKEAVPLLLGIRTSHRELSQCIARALVQIDGTEHIDYIFKNMKNARYPLKTKMLELISEIRVGDIYPKMEEYLLSEDISMRALALEVLGSRQDDRVYPHISKALSTEEKELKVSALKAAISLKCFHCGKLDQHLQNLLNDKDWETRAFTAKAMGFADTVSGEALEGLSKLLEDPSWFVRFNASESLFHLGEPGILALSETLYSEDAFARDKAWDILNREMTFFGLEERIMTFRDGETILKNITGYKEMDMEVEEVAS
jgi:HEAT repeat protein